MPRKIPEAEPERNIGLILAYDGGAYKGWQDNLWAPSIEAKLREAGERILGHSLLLQAASRTDAGVHAEGQVVNFFTEKHMPLEAMQKGLNALLPSDIRVMEMREEKTDFHPTTHARAKEYHYFLSTDPRGLSPFLRSHFWHRPSKLDVPAMKDGMKRLLGRHDFRAFCPNFRQADYADFERHLQKFELVQLEEQLWRFELLADKFLFRMARNLVGTAIYLGEGRLAADSIPLILSSGKRENAGITAPAHGLCLHKVFYFSPSG